VWGLVTHHAAQRNIELRLRLLGASLAAEELCTPLQHLDGRRLPVHEHTRHQQLWILTLLRLSSVSML
jgi:hypothetical protein